MYRIKKKGSISIGGVLYLSDMGPYSEKQLGDVKSLLSSGLIEKVEEESKEEGGIFDISEMNLNELEKYCEGMEVAELEMLLGIEKETKARKGAISMLETKIKELSDV